MRYLNVQMTDDNRIIAMTMKNENGDLIFNYSPMGNNTGNNTEKNQRFDFPIPVKASRQYPTENAPKKQGIDFNDDEWTLPAPYPPQKPRSRKTHYTTQEFITRLSEEKENYRDNPTGIKNLKKFYDFWTSPDSKDPTISKVESMNYFNFEDRLESWMTKKKF